MHDIFAAVPTRIIRRKIEGRSRAVCCATIPPSENPRTSQSRQDLLLGTTIPRV